MSLHDLLHTGPSAGLPVSRLDWALAQMLHQPTTDMRHLWLAALTSHQWSRGHACLDLHALQTDPATCLGWTHEQVARLPSNLPDAAANLPWCAGESGPLVYAPSGARPRL